MVFTKKATRSSDVMVETKRLSAKDSCNGGLCCMRVKHLVMSVLVILNTLLLVWVLCNQVNLEAAKVGGRANYKMVQQIYKSPAFKAQQTQQIQQALQMYQGGTQTAPGTDAAPQLPVVTPQAETPAK